MFNPFISNNPYSVNVANNPYFNPAPMVPNPWYTSYQGAIPVDPGYMNYPRAPVAAYCTQLMPNQYTQSTNPIPYTPNMKNMEQEKQKESPDMSVAAKNIMKCHDAFSTFIKNAIASNSVEIISTTIIPYALRIDGIVFVPVDIGNRSLPFEENYDGE